MTAAGGRRLPTWSRISGQALTGAALPFTTNAHGVAGPRSGVPSTSMCWRLVRCLAHHSKSKLPAPKVAGVCCKGWKFTSIGHAPNLSKPFSFDFMCNRMDGAWRYPTFLLLMPIHLSPEGLSVLGNCAVKSFE